jgi:calcium/calmodulin-dependent protein kinase (CaM kinase) II
MTCIEPESKGMVVEGKDFHRYYFDLAASRQTTLNNDSGDRPGPPSIPTNVTMSQPHVRLIANDTVAIISCIRLNQTGTCTTQISETRVWELRDGEWKHVHFHKS